jgi:pilus assembly protein Flp/PilA
MRSRIALVDVLGRFLADESGAATSEYALVASGIALAILASLIALGSRISGVFSTASTIPN